jgi:hypothetical protein
MTEKDFSQEAGSKEASEDVFNDKDTGEVIIKNSSEEAGFEDAFKDAVDDEDTGEDGIKNVSEEEARVG